jgi:hypothetical protein
MKADSYTFEELLADVDYWNIEVEKRDGRYRAALSPGSQYWPQIAEGATFMEASNGLFAALRDYSPRMKYSPETKRLLLPKSDMNSQAEG